MPAGAIEGDILNGHADAWCIERRAQTQGILGAMGLHLRPGQMRGQQHSRKETYPSTHRVTLATPDADLLNRIKKPISGSLLRLCLEFARQLRAGEAKRLHQAQSRRAHSIAAAP